MSWSIMLLIAATPASHLAVLELDAQGITTAEQKSLTEVFTEEVARHFAGKVYSKDELREMLLREERVQRLDTCDDRGCYAELALALGAELMIEGSLIRMGAAVTMTASLIDTRSAAISSRASLEWRGPAEGLADAMRALAQRLMIAEAAQAPGSVLFSAETPGATVTIDGKMYGVTPIGRAAGLAIGAHELIAQAEDHQPLARPFIVLHKRDTVIDLLLQPEEESPLYAKWWVWTIAGAAAVGASVAVVAIAAGRDVERPPVGTVEVMWMPR